MRLAASLACALVLCSTLRVAWAQPPGLQTETRPVAATRSPSMATALSLAGIGVSLGLVAAGGVQRDEDLGLVLHLAGSASLFIMPSAGHWYAGRFLTRGLGIRVIGSAIGALGVLQIQHAISTRGDLGETSAGGGVMLLVLGGLTVLGGVVHDVVTASSAAQAANLAARTGVVPWVAPSSSGAAAGAALTGSF